MHNAVIGVGVVNRHGHTKSTTSSICGPCLALRSNEESFVDVSDHLTTLTTCHDAYISRFSVDNNDNNNDDRWTDRLLYPLRMCAG